VAALIFSTRIFKNPTEPIAFSEYWKNSKINNGCLVFAATISDTFLLYRSYILYNSRLRVVALPLVVLVIEYGFGVWNIISFPPSPKGGTDPWEDRYIGSLTLATTIFGFISFAMNVMCTSLIIARLWRSHRQLLASGVLNPPRTYVQVGAIIINSAALNILWMVICFVTATISSLVFIVISQSFACITALIFSTIIVSASSSPSSESFSGTNLSDRVSFAPQVFVQGFAPSDATAELSTDDMLGARIHLVEFSSPDNSDK
jgi:hypothetical protein